MFVKTFKHGGLAEAASHAGNITVLVRTCCRVCIISGHWIGMVFQSGTLVGARYRLARAIQVMGETSMKRRGFTLVELLVVIAIIAMLVTLLLPAVQAARAAARRSQCQNNLKNLALGLNNYVSAFGQFPPGWIAKTNNQAEWGWNVLIFPFVEEQSLYDSMQVNERRLWDVILDPKTRGLVQTPLPLFRCPEDQQNDLLPGGRNSFSAPIERHFRCANCPGAPQFEPATSNYMGVSGFFDRSRHVPIGKDNGVLHANSEVKIGQIIDGTSKTFAVGERDRRCKQGAWCGAKRRAPPTARRGARDENPAAGGRRGYMGRDRDK